MRALVTGATGFVGSHIADLLLKEGWEVDALIRSPDRKTWLDRMPGVNKVAGSLVALHPESDPWHGAWQLGVGDVLEATVVRWVEKADRCGDAGGHLLALRPAALVMLCGHEAGRFRSGETVTVRVTAIDARQRKVTVALVT